VLRVLLSEKQIRGRGLTLRQVVDFMRVARNKGFNPAFDGDLRAVVDVFDIKDFEVIRG